MTMNCVSALPSSRTSTATRFNCFSVKPQKHRVRSNSNSYDGSCGCMAGQRIAALAPRTQPALQGPNALDSVLSQEERHTGARGLIRSSAVQHDFSVAWETVIAPFELLRLHVQRSRNRFRLGFEVHGMPQVHDG